MGSPKQGSALRHGGHAHSAHHLPAAVTNARAALFAAGLLIVTLISILGFNLSSMDPREPTSRAACGGNHVGPGDASAPLDQVHMVLLSVPQPVPLPLPRPGPELGPGQGTESPYHDKRSEVYDKMEADFYDKGAEFLFGSSSTTSQSLKLSDIFELRNGELHPVLKREPNLNPKLNTNLCHGYEPPLAAAGGFHQRNDNHVHSLHLNMAEIPVFSLLHLPTHTLSPPFPFLSPFPCPICPAVPSLPSPLSLLKHISSSPHSLHPLPAPYILPCLSLPSPSQPARPPVRANVLRMDPEFAASIHLTPISVPPPLSCLPPGVWLQDPDVYHMSIFHASHHLSPVPATAKQLADEVRAVKGVSKRLCPMRVSLDRVILTATGVLLACWQVVEGTDPAELRDELKEALPRAPKQQLVGGPS
ncbi:unnamed protein product [Closterium sp. NIES-53]